MPWAFMSGFTAVAVAGILAGTYLLRFVPQLALKRGFAASLLIMGTAILYQNWDGPVPNPAAQAFPKWRTRTTALAIR